MEKHDDQFSTLIPLLALGIIVILIIMIFRSFLTTTQIQPIIVIPAGSTYLGK